MEITNNIYTSNIYEIEFKFIAFTNNLITVLKNIAGLIGVIFIFMPLYYAALLPFAIISFNLLYKKLNIQNSKNIEQFKEFSGIEKQKILDSLKKTNKQFAIKSKLTYKVAKANYLYYKPIYKKAKQVNDLMIDFEIDLQRLSTNEKIIVSDYSDKELKEFIIKNQVQHNLV